MVLTSLNLFSKYGNIDLEGYFLPGCHTGWSNTNLSLIHWSLFHPSSR